MKLAVSFVILMLIAPIIFAAEITPTKTPQAVQSPVTVAESLTPQEIENPALIKPISRLNGIPDSDIKQIKIDKIKDLTEHPELWARYAKAAFGVEAKFHLVPGAHSAGGKLIHADGAALDLKGLTGEPKINDVVMVGKDSFRILYAGKDEKDVTVKGAAKIEADKGKLIIDGATIDPAKGKTTIQKTGREYLINGEGTFSSPKGQPMSFSASKSGQSFQASLSPDGTISSVVLSGPEGSPDPATITYMGETITSKRKELALFFKEEAFKKSSIPSKVFIAETPGADGKTTLVTNFKDLLSPDIKGEVVFNIPGKPEIKVDGNHFFMNGREYLASQGKQTMASRKIQAQEPSFDDIIIEEFLGGHDAYDPPKDKTRLMELRKQIAEASGFGEAVNPDGTLRKKLFTWPPSRGEIKIPSGVGVNPLSAEFAYEINAIAPGEAPTLKPGQSIDWARLDRAVKTSGNSIADLFEQAFGADKRARHEMLTAVFEKNGMGTYDPQTSNPKALEIIKSLINNQDVDTLKQLSATGFNTDTLYMGSAPGAIRTSGEGGATRSRVGMRASVPQGTPGGIGVTSYEGYRGEEASNLHSLVNRVFSQSGLTRTRISSPFGHREAPTEGASTNHKGVDIPAPKGTTVNSASDGEVVSSGRMGGKGLTVIVLHPDGTRTQYGHFSKLLVKKGQKVSLTTPIGEVGRTGTATGNHLHFEKQVAIKNKKGQIIGWRSVDPANYSY